VKMQIIDDIPIKYRNVSRCFVSGLDDERLESVSFFGFMAKGEFILGLLFHYDKTSSFQFYVLASGVNLV